jgi:hypothetical protein
MIVRAGMLVQVLGWAALGAALGAVFFATLAYNARLYLGPWSRAVLLQLGRLALLTALLVCAARRGAWPLIAAGAGILAARPVVTARLLGGRP